MAKEKAAELPHNEMCGKRHAITRQSRRYLTVVFFCGAWSCPRCADFFRRRWLDHLQTATAGSNLYILKSLESDWGRLRRSLNRLGAEYIKVITGSEITIILNKEVTGSSPILQDKLSELLDTLLPHKTQTCPISTSRGWQRAKKLDNNPDEVEKPVLVTHTWLPIDVQQYVAKKLGATLDGDQRWVSPEDQDAQGWENEFTKQLMILEQDLWSQIKQKGQSIEAWLNDFQRDMEADDVFDRGRERWEVMAG
jgi:hypothetical protein